MRVETLAVSLVLTLALELPFAYCWGLRDRHNLAVAALVNVLTNPVVVLLYFAVSARTGWPSLVIQLPLEAAAVAVEAWCYAGCGRGIKRPVPLALCANGLSYCAGLALSALLL